MRRAATAAAALLIGASSARADDALNAALARAARTLPLADIDFDARDCKDTRTVGQWLDETVLPASRSVRWAGGTCRLRVRERPSDSGTPWCGFALIVPKAGGRVARVEINFERPRGVRPGKPIAFRGVVPVQGSEELLRRPFEFKAAWRGEHDPSVALPDDSPCP